MLKEWEWQMYTGCSQVTSPVENQSLEEDTPALFSLPDSRFSF